MDLPRLRAAGFLFIGDAHLAGQPPGQRREGYREQILAKVRAALELSRALDLVPVFLGDLFHWPRENPNSLLVELIELFRPYRPFVLVGNHDKYQARFTDDVSMAVLDAAGVVNVLKEPGPALSLDTDAGQVILGGSPDASPLPVSFAKAGAEQVVWVTHHNLNFPDFPEKTLRLREIPGLDWVINGHIHRPQPTIRTGATVWANPGNIARLTFARHVMARRPAVHAWRPGQAELERRELPFLPFAEVFPDQEPPEAAPVDEAGRSLFLEGLERLAWRRTREGWGLKQFLQANLNPELPESALAWELYEEALRHARDK